MVKYILISSFAILSAVTLLVNANEVKTTKEQDVLVKSCFSILDIYKNNDLDLFISLFPKEASDLKFRDKFRKKLIQKKN